MVISMTAPVNGALVQGVSSVLQSSNTPYGQYINSVTWNGYNGWNQWSFTPGAAAGTFVIQNQQLPGFLTLGGQLGAQTAWFVSGNAAGFFAALTNSAVCMSPPTATYAQRPVMLYPSFPKAFGVAAADGQPHQTFTVDQNTSSSTLSIGGMVMVANKNTSSLVAGLPTDPLSRWFRRSDSTLGAQGSDGVWVCVLADGSVGSCVGAPAWIPSFLAATRF